MPTHLFVAVVHAIGEDNEGNTSIVARTRESLDAKLLAHFQECDQYLADEDEEAVAVGQSLDDYLDTYDWQVDEHDLDD